MSRMTKATLVTTALELVGVPEIQTTAETWLDLILQHLALTVRWPELHQRYSGAVADGTETLAYPTNYAFLLGDPTTGAVGKFTDTKSNSSLIYEATLARLRPLTSHSTDGKGTPAFISDDAYNSRWLLHPISNVAGTIYLEYQITPANVASAAVVWFQDDLALVEAVKFMAERREMGSSIQLDAQISNAAMVAMKRSPSRAKLFALGGAGMGLDRTMFS